MKKIQIKFISYFIILFLVFIYIYTLFHELGHGIIGLICGGEITKINLGFNAYISIINANYNNFTYALMNISGMLFPIIILLIILIFYRQSIKNNFYHLIYFIFSIGITGSIFAWIVLPIVSLFTSLPETDDVSKFLETTSFHPILVSLGSIMLMGIIIILIYKKGLFSKLILIKKELKSNN